MNSEPLPITTEDADSIRDLHRLSKEGEHHMALCPLCARPTWTMTHTDQAAAVIVRVGERPCDPCGGIALRHPEVFNWIVDVLKGRRLIEKLLSASRK